MTQKNEPVHLMRSRGEPECNTDSDNLDPDINRVTCEDCIRCHDEHVTKSTWRHTMNDRLGQGAVSEEPSAAEQEYEEWLDDRGMDRSRDRILATATITLNSVENALRDSDLPPQLVRQHMDVLWDLLEEAQNASSS